MRKIATVAVIAVTLAPLAALAQVTYRCTGKDGKRYYGSTLPAQCAGLPAEQLNAQGTVIRRIDPQREAQELATKAAEAERKKQNETQERESARRDNALLATYTSENDIEIQRGRALADNQRAVKDVQTRIEAIKKRQATYQKELESSGGKNPPAKLQEDLKQSEYDLEAQQNLLAVKTKEVDSINAKYDADKKRFLALTKRQ